MALFVRARNALTGRIERIPEAWLVQFSHFTIPVEPSAETPPTQAGEEGETPPGDDESGEAPVVPEPAESGKTPQARRQRARDTHKEG